MYVDAAGRRASSGEASKSHGCDSFQNAAAGGVWLQYSGESTAEGTLAQIISPVTRKRNAFRLDALSAGAIARLLLML
jgi:hypothetical protein